MVTFPRFAVVGSACDPIAKMEFLHQTKGRLVRVCSKALHQMNLAFGMGRIGVCFGSSANSVYNSYFISTDKSYHDFRKSFLDMNSHFMHGFMHLGAIERTLVSCIYTAENLPSYKIEWRLSAFGNWIGAKKGYFRISRLDQIS